MLREIGVQHFWPVAPEAESRPPAPAVGPVSVQALVEAAVPMATTTHAMPTKAPAAAAHAAPAAPVAPPRSARPGSVAAPTPESRPAVVLGPRPVGVETMDWPALRESVASCQACTLCEKRRQTVFGVGNPRAHWMLVGEAPGEDEDRQGEPFVGRSGQLLDRMLQAVGLSRAEAPPEQQVFIANVIKCRPPGNRNPMPEEVAQCEPFLLRQVALLQPRVILAMGRFAVQSLLKSSEPIGKLRGKVHDYAGVPLVVTYHPAYLLRNPVDKALAWDDLCLARELINRPETAGA
jgi:uracil-DNA glycosylase